MHLFNTWPSTLTKTRLYLTESIFYQLMTFSQLFPIVLFVLPLLHLNQGHTADNKWVSHFKEVNHKSTTIIVLLLCKVLCNCKSLGTLELMHIKDILTKNCCFFVFCQRFRRIHEFFWQRGEHDHSSSSR